MIGRKSGFLTEPLLALVKVFDTLNSENKTTNKNFSNLVLSDRRLSETYLDYPIEIDACDRSALLWKASFHSIFYWRHQFLFQK